MGEFLMVAIVELLVQLIIGPIFKVIHWVGYHLVGAPFRLLGTLLSWPFDKKTYPNFAQRYLAGANGRIGFFVVFVIGLLGLMIFYH